MRKTYTISAVSCLILSLTGCATPYPIGSIWTNVTLPVTATSNAGSGSKVGEATCKSYLTMFSLGDCSIDNAKKNGNITKVNHVDWHSSNFLGLIGTYTLRVHGD